MKNTTGPRGMTAAVDVVVFSFTGTDPVSFGVCAAGRAMGIF
jgi:hypothetical protein